jgi:hypothetical protein
VEVRTTRGLILIAAVLTSLIAVGVAQARHLTKTATAQLQGGGTLEATVTYTPSTDSDKLIRLTIRRAGLTLLSTKVTSQACRGLCSVQDIRASDLQGDGEPVVMLDLFTGGGHCCSVTDFYTYDASRGSYRRYEHDWGDPGYRERTLGGQTVLETADDRFAYRWTDFAASGLPIQFFTFNGSGLVNVTRRFPAAITRDAAVDMRAFRAMGHQHDSDTTGVVAAWAADEDELGHRAEVKRFLTAQARAGHLRAGVPGMPENAVYVKKLNAFLAKAGYLS